MNRGKTMNLIVFGANGGIGHHVVEQALDAGHTVTAVVRRPSSLAVQHKNLIVFQGDVLQPVTLRESMAGQTAVISAIGTHARGPTTVYSEGIANIIQAMEEAHVRRLLCVSATALDPSVRWQRWFAKPFLWMLLKNMYT